MYLSHATYRCWPCLLKTDWRTFGQKRDLLNQIHSYLGKRSDRRGREWDSMLGREWRSTPVGCLSLLLKTEIMNEATWKMETSRQNHGINRHIFYQEARKNTCGIKRYTRGMIVRHQKPICHKHPLPWMLFIFTLLWHSESKQSFSKMWPLNVMVKNVKSCHE